MIDGKANFQLLVLLLLKLYNEFNIGSIYVFIGNLNEIRRISLRWEQRRISVESRLQFKVYEGGGRLGSHEATLPNTRAEQFLRLLACDWSIVTNTDFFLVVEDTKLEA